MSRHTLALSFAAVLAACVVSSTYGSEAVMSLKINASTPTVSLGHTLVVQVELTNTSDREIRLYRAVGHVEAEVTYSVMMSDSAGRAVQRTPYGDAAEKNQLVGSRRVVTLEPGQNLTQKMELTKLFRIVQPGTYALRVGRRWPAETGQTVWSNTLILTVTK